MSKEDYTTVIMAGGRSSRMGTDKAFVPLLGKPMIEHVLDSVDGLGSEKIIITNSIERYRYLGLPLFADIYEGSGPLGGLHTALVHAKCEHLLVVACDMPWLNRDLLEYMVSLRATADVIVPRWTKFPEPLHAVYSKACLKPVTDSLESRTLKLIAFYGQVRVRYLDRDVLSRFDAAGRSFANINTLEDLRQAGEEK
ncbi:MAG: molybdenum cofactor guanylyltransferase [Chloroflexota bacterium]|nr:MAG: molybdenum cofactor guanylyltransferase [Chloroflexota bacterium]